MVFRDRIFALYWKIFPMRIMRYHLWRIDEFVKRAARECDSPGVKLIDIGSEDGRYRRRFQQLTYVTQDYQQNVTNSIDIIGDLNERLPVADASYDVILCTQVLEHIREPQRAFAEFARILKPGGRIYLTTHQCFEEHMVPYDYFRFTSYGLKYLGTSHGFTIEHFAPHGGIFQVLAHIVDIIPIRIAFKRGVLYYAYIAIASVPLCLFNALCAALDHLDKEKRLTINYECIYRKP